MVARPTTRRSTGGPEACPSSWPRSRFRQGIRRCVHGLGNREFFVADQREDQCERPRRKPPELVTVWNEAVGRNEERVRRRRSPSAVRHGVREEGVDLDSEIVGVLEERAVTGVRVDHQAGSRDVLVYVVGVGGWHHVVRVPIDDQGRHRDVGQVVGGGKCPSV